MASVTNDQKPINVTTPQQTPVTVKSDNRTITVIDSNTPWYNSKIVQTIGAVFLGVATAVALAFAPVGLPILACVGIGAAVTAATLVFIFAGNTTKTADLKPADPTPAPQVQKTDVTTEQVVNEPQSQPTIPAKMSEEAILKLAPTLSYLLSKIQHLPGLAEIKARSTELDDKIQEEQTYYNMEIKRIGNHISDVKAEIIRQHGLTEATAAFDRVSNTQEDVQKRKDKLERDLAFQDTTRKEELLRPLKAPLLDQLANFNSMIGDLNAALTKIIATENKMDTSTKTAIENLASQLPQE